MPVHLRDFLSSFDPRIRGLTGTNEQIAAVTKEFRVYYKRFDESDGSYIDGPFWRGLPDGQDRKFRGFSLISNRGQRGDRKVAQPRQLVNAWCKSVAARADR